MTKKDYILIAIDPESKFAIRFASLNHAIQKSLDLHKPNAKLKKLLTEMLLCSITIGSRSDEQETNLYQLKFSHSSVRINCEVSPIGAFRSAIFPHDKKEDVLDKPEGQLRVVVRKNIDDLYQSIISIKDGDVLKTFQSYLIKSDQRKSVLLIHTDIKDFKKNYVMWVDKLPATALRDWNKFKQRFDKKSFFTDSFQNTNDPDRIIQHLFPESIRILAVTKPFLECSCSKAKIIEALKLLPHEDLIECFMDGQGIETQCDYCHKIWTVSDADLKDLLKTSSAIH